MKRQAKRERYEYYCQGFNKCMKKEKGEINLLVYMGKWRDLVKSRAEILPEGRALSEHAYVTK